METQNFTAGTVVFKQGDESDKAYFIKKGVGEAYFENAEGKTFRREFGEGQFCGEIGIIVDGPRSASFRAKTDMEVEVFDEASFDQEILSNPDRLKPYLTKTFENVRAIVGQLLNGVSGATVEGDVEAEDVEGGAAAEGATVRFSSQEGAAGSSRPIDVAVDKLPFNIGRSSESVVLSDNDLYLDDERPHSVSRAHCSIEKRGGRLVVRDRFSHVGTFVNGVPIGAKTRNFFAALIPGENTLVLGKEDSAFRFTITVS